jgi:hypothetical protein
LIQKAVIQKGFDPESCDPKGCDPIPMQNDPALASGANFW